MIKVLVSTSVSQDERQGDFCFVPEGELVARYGFVCDSERPDGSGCGCGRSFSGLRTHRATTTAMVVEMDMTLEEWRSALYETLVDTGWAGVMDDDDVADLIDEVTELDLDEIQDLPTGQVLGRLAYNDERRITRDTLLLRGLRAA